MSSRPTRAIVPGLPFASSHAPRPPAVGSEAISRRLDRQTVFVRPPPELDAATVGALIEQLDQVGPNEDAILDLRHVTFCGAAGLNALIAAHHRIDAIGSSLVLSNPPPLIERLLAICALDELFTVRRPPRARRRRMSGADAARR